jgi:peptide/nickel transport system permease protein
VTFYVIRRVAVGIVLMFVMSFLFFTLTRITPGKPLEVGENPRLHQDQVCHRLHLRGLVDENCHDYPIPQQYVLYLGALLHGDLGDSYQYNRPVTTLLADRVPNSVLLYATSIFVALVIGVPLGILAATRQYSKIDVGTSLLSYVGFSMPSFILGIMLLTFFGVFLHDATKGAFSFPLSQMHSSPDDTGVIDLAFHMVLPVASLALLSTAQFSRFMRASLLEVLHQDYIRTARAKGLAPFKVNYKHALRNAILPLITIVALSAPVVVSGAIITEGIFSWPGIGQAAFQASVVRDYPVILGVVMMVAFVTVLFNLLADIAYAVADPRIRY